MNNKSKIAPAQLTPMFLNLEKQLIKHVRQLSKLENMVQN